MRILDRAVYLHLGTKRRWLVRLCESFCELSALAQAPYVTHHQLRRLSWARVLLEVTLSVRTAPFQFQQKETMLQCTMSSGTAASLSLSLSPPGLARFPEETVTPRLRTS
ncbi:hypothetical protein CR513_37395, partial [Mucuna pruriens]